MVILSTLTWKPACSSRFVAAATGRPIGSGMGTSAGPDDTSTVIVSPWWYAEPAAGCCPTIVPCAAVLLEVCGVSRFTPCALAHCSAACTFIPKKLGSGGLAATRIANAFVCGHDLPATRLVARAGPPGGD